MSDNLLRHTALQDDLRQNGFAVVDFLSTEELSEFRKVYAEFRAAIDQTSFNGIHMTNWIADKTVKYAIKNKLEALLKKPMDRFFQNYTAINQVFIVKNKHKVSNFPLHQDWSFVDEDRHESINVWLPLQDTSVRNGGVYVIRGSHALRNTLRGAGPLSFDFSRFNKALDKYLVPVSLKAGQALLFYHSLIHGSPANTTHEPRIIVASAVISDQAELVINQLDENTRELHRYRVNKNFMFEYEDIRSESEKKTMQGELLSTIRDFRPASYTFPELESRISAYYPKLQPTILERLKNMLPGSHK